MTDDTLDIRKVNPFTLTMPDNNYWSLGENLGKAWNIGKNLEKQKCWKIIANHYGLITP